MDTQQHCHDLREVCGWLGAEHVDQLETRLVRLPLSLFAKQIAEMAATYDEFPEDKARTERIVNLLNAGGESQPVYIEDGDESLFIMEGRHRIVAFHWANCEYVDVCFCQRKA